MKILFSVLLILLLWTASVASSGCWYYSSAIVSNNELVYKISGGSFQQTIPINELNSKFSNGNVYMFAY